MIQLFLAEIITGVNVIHCSVSSTTNCDNRKLIGGVISHNTSYSPMGHLKCYITMNLLWYGKNNIA